MRAILASSRGPKMNSFLGIIRGNQDLLGTLIFGGVFERHPGLRVVVADRVLEVEEQVERAQGVAEVHEEPGDPGPPEVRVLAGVHPEPGCELLKAQRSHLGARQRHVSAAQDERHGEYDDRGRRRDGFRELRPVGDLGDADARAGLSRIDRALPARRDG